MEILTLFLRTVLIYFVVFLVMRMMGKREIGKLSIFDLVISIMIAEIAVFVIEDTHKSLWHGLIPMGTLVMIQIIMAFITLKSQKIRTIVDGTPSVLIENGKLKRKEMAKQRYSLDDLLLQLRQNKVRQVADVELAMLEPSGKLSVFTKHDNVAERISEQNPFIRFEGLPIPLIMDGKVQDGNLEQIQQNRFWLKSELEEKGISDFKQVFLCTVDHRGKFYIDLKHR